MHIGDTAVTQSGVEPAKKQPVNKGECWPFAAGVEKHQCVPQIEACMPKVVESSETSVGEPTDQLAAIQQSQRGGCPVVDVQVDASRCVTSRMSRPTRAGTRGQTNVQPK